MKLPILRPGLEAVLFGFERIGMVIRIGWFPVFLSFLAFAGLLYWALASAGVTISSIGDEFDRGVISEPEFFDFIQVQLLMNLGLPIVFALLTACLSVAATRAATVNSYEPPSGPIYFALGLRELRYTITTVVYTIIIYLVAVVVAAAVTGVIALSGLGLEAFAADGAEGRAELLVVLPAAIAIFALVVAAIWVLLRFLPVLAIAAIENRIAFGDAWAMTKGNFWRLAFAGLFFLIVVYSAVFVFLILVMISVGLVVGVSASILGGIGGGFGVFAFGLVAIFAVVLYVGLIAFTFAAQAAFPGRVYAYLSACGVECGVYGQGEYPLLIDDPETIRL